ncbi:MAG: hypothetical protein NTW17_01305 [Candidatus Pacearchaeota archaeon]|nr:hypothetical protein [Candidatus Pacearchaeota archaeon]
MNCSICGVADSQRKIFRAISPTEMVFVCEKCAIQEGFPILKGQKIGPEDEAEKTVYERMTALSGINPKEHEPFEHRIGEKDFRRVMDRTNEDRMKKQALNLKARPDLVDNFHWIIMRVRRVKGLTQKDLSDRIGEQESVIKMAEQGIVPEGYVLIDKLERFLKVKLVKSRDLSIPTKPVSQTSQPQKPVAARALNFDKKVLDSLTIADLQRMKKEREAAGIAEESEDQNHGN